MKTVDVGLIEFFVGKQKTLAESAISAIKSDPEDYSDVHGLIQYHEGIKSMCDTMLEFVKEVKEKK